MAVPMANDPPFATLNHFAADLGIPSESDLLRIGITLPLRSMGRPRSIKATVRGAGADQTILTGQNIINLGNGFNVSLGTAITSGATKDSTTFTVASTANLSVRTMIEIDRDDDTNLIVNTGNQVGG